MTGWFHISLFEGTLHVDKIHVRFKIANIKHALPVTAYQQTDFAPFSSPEPVVSWSRGLVALWTRMISHRNLWSFRVYMIALRDFVPGWNSRPGTTSGVNSSLGDSRRHDIFWWYHVNKCRAMRGNRSELTSKQKSPRCHVNTPLTTSWPWVACLFYTCIVSFTKILSVHELSTNQYILNKLWYNGIPYLSLCKLANHDQRSSFSIKRPYQVIGERVLRNVQFDIIGFHL